MHQRLLLALNIGLVIVSTVWAFDTWPQWRGPHRTGHSAEKGLRDEWKAAPPLVWKSGRIGFAHAGIVVDGSLVCTLVNRDGRSTVIALSDENGREVWATKIGGHNGSAQGTPTMDGERIYAVSGDGGLACLKTATGEIVWEKSFKKEYDGRVQHCGYAESPLVDGDKLICTPGDPKAGIVALDKKTGAELWRSELSFQGGKDEPGASYSSIMISHGAGIKQYVQLMKAGLAGVDAATGKQLWSYAKIGSQDNPCTSIIRGDYIFNPCGWFNGSPLLKLERNVDGGITAKEIYFLAHNKLAFTTGGALLVGDYIYGGNSQGGLICVEFMTGKMMWPKERGPGGGAAAVAYADGHVYAQYHNGVVALYAATPEKYQLKGEFSIPGNNGGYSHPAISNGRLYVRGHDTIYCYDLKK